MKRLAVVITALAGLCATADTMVGPLANGGVKVQQARGGKGPVFVETPGKGRVAVVDYQTRMPSNAVLKAISVFAGMTHVHLAHEAVAGKWEMGKAYSALAASGAQAAVFIVDEPAYPMSLVASEANWGLVNVHPLLVDAPTDEVKVSRMVKVFVRAAALAFGAGDATPLMGVMKPVTRGVIGIDAIKEPMLTPAALSAIGMHLGQLGITSNSVCSYLKACREGWAPKPENEAQQKIWDRVKQEKEGGPTNPIVIKPPQK